MSEKEKIEYKCPKCSVWDDGFPITKGIIYETMQCNCCGHKGKLKEFEAKKYYCYAQICITVIAFSEEDARKEFEEIKKENIVDLETSFIKMIKIEEK